MTPPHESLQPDEIPTHAQVLRFRDGREGVVAGVNQAAAVVYVGPQAFTIPRGDWPEAFRDAVVVPPPATVLATRDPGSARTGVDPAPVFPPDVDPANMTAGQVLVMHDLIPEQVPTASATLQFVPTPPDAPVPTTGNRPSRRERQRKP